ncbi:cytoplasmic protein [Catellatospora bangladeshensis]|uniref:cytoplasmic protein n=1 Tax=Catellatospora bangladeshensis TaxID=310355 RepID=UPI001943C38E|nr:cytoplasmic protein [Catellatospora bangladeshensis]
MPADDPVVTDPGHYRLLFENERVRVLEYRDRPGDRTHPHRHPDSVMYTLSAFDRRVSSGGRQAEVSLAAGEVRWVGAQEHTGENTGTTDTHTIFVELKEPRPPSAGPGAEVLGPQAASGGAG